MKIQKITNVVIVQNIQAEAKVWTALGFQMVVEIPHGESTGFAILALGEHELMLQTMPSLKEDLPAVAAALGSRTSYLYNEVENLKDTQSKLAAQKILVPERETFYGTREFFIQTPSGEVIGFSQKS